MAVIELTGPPCSGKSYSLETLVSVFQATIVDRSWVDGKLGTSRRAKLVRFIYRETWLLITGLRVLGFKRSLSLCASIFSSQWTLGRKLNSIRNVVSKFSINKLANMYINETLIVDEGITHIPYIFATSRAKCPIEVQTYFPYGCPSVVYKAATRSQLYERLELRGHSMLNGNWTISDFVEANVKVQFEQRQLFDRHVSLLDVTPAEINKK